MKDEAMVEHIVVGNCIWYFKPMCPESPGIITAVNQQDKTFMFRLFDSGKIIGPAPFVRPNPSTLGIWKPATHAEIARHLYDIGEELALGIKAGKRALRDKQRRLRNLKAALRKSPAPLRLHVQKLRK